MPRIYNLICDGNSITQGNSASNANLTAWPPVCRELLISSQAASHSEKYWLVKNVAISGNTTGQRAAAFNTDVQPQFSTAYGRNIVTFFEVSNDVITNAATLNTAITNVQAYVTQARNSGWEVMLSTVPPTTTTTNSANIVIPQFNTWLRDNPTWSDFPIVEIANHASLSNPANTTFYNVDGLHMTDAGYAVVAGLFHDAIVATVDSGPTTAGLLKRVVYDFDQLEKSSPSVWATKVSAITTVTYRRLFQGGNMDRLRFRYQVYGYDDERLAVVYAELVAALTP